MILPNKGCIALLVIICSVVAFSAYAQTTGGFATATLAGRIVDTKTDEPLVGATVLVMGTTLGSATDLDGKFSVKVPAGTYAIEGRSIGYTSKRIEGVIVKAGQELLLTISLQSSDLQVQEVEIVANIARNNESNLLQDQRAASGISSGVTAELLSKTPDRSVAESLRRISGASIREGKYAVVRGLQERYNQGQVNGMAQPSTEADKKAFSLDLFPTSLVDKINIYKTGTPDLPGDFVGGVINVVTLDIPFSNSITASVGGEYHSITTGKTYLRGTTSATDWLGFDNGTRQLPKGIYNRAESNLDPGAQREARQGALQNNKFLPSNSTAAAPNISGQIFVGRRGKVFGKTAGLIVGMTYFRTFTFSRFFNEQRNFTTNANGETINNGYDSVTIDRYRSTGNVSFVANFSFRPTASSKLSFRNLYVLRSVSQYQQGNTSALLNLSQPPFRTKSYLDYFEENRIGSHQLSFDQNIGTDGAKWETLLGLGTLNRNTPDFKRLGYTDNSGGQAGAPPDFVGNLSSFSKLFNPGIAGKFTSTLNEQSWNATSSLTLPFKFAGLKQEFKTGGAYLYRDRVYSGRNFLYGYASQGGTVSARITDILRLGPNQIFDPKNFGGGLINLIETTSPTDFYKAYARNLAGFTMLQTYFGENSKIIYGLRAERYYQTINTANLFTIQPIYRNSIWVDILPSVNTQFGLAKNIYLRLAYFKSVNRPEFRELSPALFYDPQNNFLVSGNDTLTRAKVHNFDAKLEWYPTSGSVLSLNAFYKRIDKPIEQTRIVTSGLTTFTYTNNKNGIIRGLELEARSSLGFLAPADTRTHKLLAAFTPFANVSIMRSVLTNLFDDRFKRPLQGQSPYVINLGASYSHPTNGLQAAFYLNRTGTRLAFIGDGYTTSIWESPRTVVDVNITYTNKKWTYKAVLGDLLAQKQIFFQPLGDDVNEFDPNSRRDFLWAPIYKAGQDQETFSITYGRTIRFVAAYQF